MGRIKTALIKRVTFSILEKYQDLLGTDFNKNKLVVEQKTDVTSKKLRNVIAGYLTRLTKNKDKERPRQRTKEDLSKFY